MVDTIGTIILGSVPRPLVHRLNLLHRGVGVLVFRDRHIMEYDDNEDDKDGRTPPDVYCHRRTETKRIFPSLYDMFVGGVSTSGETSISTAAREVLEELGLEHGLKENIIDCQSCSSPSSSSTEKVSEAADTTGERGDEGEREDRESTTNILSPPLFKCTVCMSYNR